jgi:hypothetical protein
VDTPLKKRLHCDATRRRRLIPGFVQARHQPDIFKRMSCNLFRPVDEAAADLFTSYGHFELG